MALNDIAAGAAAKKQDLHDNDFGRFAVRATMAGVYLMLGTAFAGNLGNVAEKLAPGVGLGAVVFGMTFFIGLYSIIILGAELATGTMMYLCYAALQKKMSWGKALVIIVTTTIFNLIGALICGLMLAQAAKFSGMTPADLLPTLWDGKLAKSPGGLLIEGILANLVVNMAIVAAALVKEGVSKFFTLMLLIGVFASLGLEHVIANFCLFAITFFASDPLSSHFTAGAVATNWGIVWLGNLIGGGVLMGCIYGWLNTGRESYRD